MKKIDLGQQSELSVRRAISTRAGGNARCVWLRAAGFTLVELMVGVSVAAVLLVVGVPSLKYSLEVNQLATETNRLVSALHLARSEAVKRNLRVTLCKSADGAACDNGGAWENGWFVFIDDGAGGGTGSDAIRNGTEEIIKSESGALGPITFPGSDNLVIFAGDGTSRLVGVGSGLANPVLIVTLDSDLLDEPSRCLRVRGGGGITRENGTGC